MELHLNWNRSNNYPQFKNGVLFFYFSKCPQTVSDLLMKIRNKLAAQPQNCGKENPWQINKELRDALSKLYGFVLHCRSSLSLPRTITLRLHSFLQALLIFLRLVVAFCPPPNLSQRHYPTLPLTLKPLRRSACRWLATARRPHTFSHRTATALPHFPLPLQHNSTTSKLFQQGCQVFRDKWNETNLKFRINRNNGEFRGKLTCSWHAPVSCDFSALEFAV